MQHKRGSAKRCFPRLRRQRGFEFVEILVSLGLLSILFIVLMAVQKVLTVQTNSYNKVVARQLLVEESEALRNASFAGTLQPHTDKTSTFLDVAYSKGSWSITTPPNPQSGARTYTVTDVSGANDPSRAVVPAGWLGDGIYDLHLRPRDTSAPGWKAGMYLRYRDERNHYLLQATATTLSFIRVSSGTTTQLWSTNQDFFSDTWHQLTVTAHGLVFIIALDGVPLQELVEAISLFDPPLTYGRFLLNAEGGVVADFDDVQFTNTIPATLAWNFDGGSEVVGKPAYQWRSISPADLPSGATSVTLTNAQAGFTDLKMAVLTVSWYERNATRTYTNTFYLNQQSVPP